MLDSRTILEPELLPQPLDYLLASGRTLAVDGALGGEKVERVVACHLVSPSADRHGELVLTDSSVLFLDAHLAPDRQSRLPFHQVVLEEFPFFSSVPANTRLQ